MKREIIPAPKKLVGLYRGIVAVALLLILTLIAGSLYALFRPADSGPLFRINGQTAVPVPAVTAPAVSAGDTVSIFSGIRQLRIPLQGRRDATLVLSISFPYPSADGPFTEELASRIGEFRAIAGEYFSGLSVEKIENLDEEQAKAAILGRYNALLRLGKIDVLYFSDLMVVE